jgi:hypothetical protein
MRLLKRKQKLAYMTTNNSCMDGNENKTQSNISAWMGMKTKPKATSLRVGGKKTKVKTACCAPYVTALVAGALGLEATILHELDPMVGCVCTPTHLAIPLFCIYIYRVWM